MAEQCHQSYKYDEVTKVFCYLDRGHDYECSDKWGGWNNKAKAPKEELDVEALSKLARECLHG